MDILKSILNDSIDIELIKSNISKNIKLLPFSKQLEEVASFIDGKPLLIVAAGPSLVDNFEKLKKILEANKYTVVLSIDRASKFLIKNGITPHYIMTAEPKPHSMIPVDGVKELSLLSYIGASYDVISRFEGDLYFYDIFYNDEEYDSLRKEFKEMDSIPRLGSGGIVTTHAISLAMLSNPAMTILIGNDLAFKDKFYFDSKESVEIDSRYIPVKIGEENYFTTLAFLYAKIWIEKLIERFEFRIFDLSFPGIDSKFVSKVR